ncbi:MAG: hypothetical protein GWN14_17450 [candidate division Zixibacteria bacterium]|nr:hypothetical protein [candidate division Zixibacteria bacterium]
MSEKFTPGPWEVCNGADVFTQTGAINGRGVAASTNDGWMIATCPNASTNTDDGECELEYSEQTANAHLIAAAPDGYWSNDELLDAIKKLIAGMPVRDLDERILRAEKYQERARG